jgi:hypothetical protein
MGVFSKLKNEYMRLKEDSPLRNPTVLLFKRIWGVFWNKNEGFFYFLD